LEDHLKNLFVLATNRYIYYFDAPYQDYASNWVSASSYMPFLLLLAIVPITMFTLKRLQSDDTRLWLKTLLVSNHLIYLLLMLGFGYWGFYTVWG
jgi:hypothetical protein